MKATLSPLQTSPISQCPGSKLPERAARPTLDPQTEAIRCCEIGGLMLSTGRHEAALMQFEQALTLQPHAIAGWSGRAEALACLNRFEEALSDIEQAQDLSTAVDIQIWIQKAAVLIFLQRYEEALSCCLQVLQRHPNHVQALLFQGVALHRMGQYRKAYRSYRRVTELTMP